jgi:hypothetical protein
MSVPEAPVYKDDLAFRLKYDIGMAGHTGAICAISTVPKAGQSLSYDPLWKGTCARNLLHTSRGSSISEIPGFSGSTHDHSFG